jgi:class 3 adenylate cyclase/tetratricopeptide (TPR) repeat protein
VTHAYVTDAADVVFRPYLPRLAIEWERDAGTSKARVIDGSLVSVDISGFTALSERLAAKGRAGAEELILLISSCYELLIDAAERHRGDVLKFRGDALLLFFAGDEHELRAARAALEMQNVMDVAGHGTSSVGPVELSMAAGVHSGQSHFFLAGTRHRELIVAGPAATATLELEDLATSGDVLVSPATAAALPRDAFAGGRDGARLLRRDADLGSTAREAHDEDAAIDVALTNLVPPPLRAPLGARAAEAEHRQATTAFVKFTGINDLVADLDDAARKVDQLATVVGETAASYGVTWLESDIDRDGGKLYLVSGAPVSAGGDEERMLRVLRTIVDSDLDISVSAGVNRGRVFAGEIGSPTRRTYAVMGDAVNVAARLASRAKRGQILAATSVVARSRARFETEAESFLVKGKDNPINAAWLGRLVETRADELDELPLVGRAAELELLQSAVDAARLRRRRVVELVGEAGIGKSRLVQALRERAARFRQLTARSEEYEASTPFFALRSLLRPLAGISPELSASEAGATLQSWVAAAMPDLAPWLPLLAVPFDAEVAATADTDDLGESFKQSKLHEVLAEFMQRTLLTPTLLVFEDAHWMDDASYFFLRHVVAHPEPVPWVVCVTRRPEGARIAEEEDVVELTPLSADETSQLVDIATGDAAVPPETAAALATRSGGNPLFVRELVAARAAGDEELPETVETVITTRIDRLDPVDRRLLRCAAVIGPRFELDLLVEVLGDEQDLDRERWDRVAEFVAWDDDAHLQFRHDLFRAVSYEGLSYRRRRDLHRNVGELLERRLGARDEEAAALLSLHFANAAEHDKAWGYAVSAGDRARAKYANVDAAELYERALSAAAHLTPDAEAVARVTESLGDVSELGARYERADSAYEEALALLAGDAGDEARLLRKRGVIHERTGRYDDALRVYDDALKAASVAGDDAAAAQLELAIAGVRYRQGDPQACADWSDRAIATAGRAGDRDALAHAYYLRGTAGLQLGTHDTSDFEIALPIYEEMGDVLSQGHVLNNLGIAAQFDGRWDAAIDFYRRSREAHERAGASVFAAGGTNNEAEVLLDQGRVEEAESLLRKALAVWRGAGYAFGIGAATANLGRAAAAASRFEDAHQLLDRALAIFEEIGSGSFALDTRARIAECLMLEGRHREAFETAVGALDESHRRGEVTPRLPLLERIIAYALHQDGRTDDAGPHFLESIRLAREQSCRFDEAAALRGLAETGIDPAQRAPADELLSELGVVAPQRIPLP